MNLSRNILKLSGNLTPLLQDIIDEFEQEFSLEDIENPKLDWNRDEYELSLLPVAKAEKESSLRIFPAGVPEKWKFKDSFTAYSRWCDPQPKTSKIYGTQGKQRTQRCNLRVTTAVKRKRISGMKRCNRVNIDREPKNSEIIQPEHSQDLPMEWDQDDLLDYLMETEDSSAGVGRSIDDFKFQEAKPGPTNNDRTIA